MARLGDVLPVDVPVGTCGNCGQWRYWRGEPGRPMFPDCVNECSSRAFADTSPAFLPLSLINMYTHGHVCVECGNMAEYAYIVNKARVAYACEHHLREAMVHWLTRAAIHYEESRVKREASDV